MNGLRISFRKKSIQKFEKSINQSESDCCSNTVLSLYFKIKAKKFHATKPHAFWLHFMFRRDQNHYSNLTRKS